MARVLLVLPAQSYRAEPFREAALRLGVELVTASDRCQRLAAHWGVPLAVDFADPVAAAAEIVRSLAGRTIDAVVPTDDASTVVAARVAAALGLPANPPAAAEAARNKWRLRQRLGAAGLRQPEHVLLASGAPAGAPGFPCVVKPLLLSGSRGVIRADDPAALEAAVARVRRILRATGGPQHGQPDADRVLVESYIPGIEVALEGLLRAGGLETLALFDKPDPLEGPFFEETLYVTPSRLPAALQAEAAATARRAALALGLVRGAVHAELRIDPEGRVWPIEVAGRSIGGLCSRTLRLGTGLTLEELILLEALGRELPEHAREARPAGVLMLPIPRRGFLREVRGLERARQLPGIESVEITAKLDHELVPLPEGSGYLGFVFARGDTPADVESALRAAGAVLEPVLSPRLVVSGTDPVQLEAGPVEGAGIGHRAGHRLGQG